jgi:hypothetical protein
MFFFFFFVFCVETMLLLIFLYMVMSLLHLNSQLTYIIFWGWWKKVQRELLLLLVQPYNSIGDVDAHAINLDIDHEETSYAHDTDRSSSITDSKGGIPSLREPFSSKLFIEWKAYHFI